MTVSLDMILGSGFNAPEPEVGDRLFVFLEYRRLTHFIDVVQNVLREKGIDYKLIGNCCFDFGGGVRMIFVVRHSKEWVNYIRGYNLISWMSDSTLPPNEEELLQSLMRRLHGNPSGGSEAKLRTRSIGPGTVG